jgi:hypothetical protein
MIDGRQWIADDKEVKQQRQNEEKQADTGGRERGKD